MYTIDDNIVLDYIGRFENIDSEFTKVMAKLGLEGQVTLPKVNVSRKDEQRSYRDFYTDKTRDLVAKWYAREIETFGYEF